MGWALVAAGLTGARGAARPVRREDGRRLMDHVVSAGDGQVQLGGVCVDEAQVLRGDVLAEQ